MCSVLILFQNHLQRHINSALKLEKKTPTRFQSLLTRHISVDFGSVRLSLKNFFLLSLQMYNEKLMTLLYEPYDPSPIPFPVTFPLTPTTFLLLAVPNHLHYRFYDLLIPSPPLSSLYDLSPLLSTYVFLLPLLSTVPLLLSYLHFLSIPHPLPVRISFLPRILSFVLHPSYCTSFGSSSISVARYLSFFLFLCCM